MTDLFLRAHSVDVGRSLAVLFVGSALVRFYSWVGASLSDRVSVDLAIPLTAALAVGLWLHRPWARWASLVCLWLAVGALFAYLPLYLTGLHKNLNLVLGDTTIHNPSGLQAIIAGTVFLSTASVLLVVLHSGKAREEIGAARHVALPS